ncbi:DUF6588 family protein [Flagellimonas allohymeniacidonis]|uniref:Outer membrane protein beta-barrel domain-containing protein n=1 Tax=Flagellimonas allohymeniacidonis TaxID=2517819 RepID=A0A4Q8QJ08_9FLAO|nr:DUF6588 family protein [Allomuricauda hymeniacidonis]TAI49847.1 hypothetical protein EW142_06980 [Allomuricauda hymeniacidonis]
MKRIVLILVLCSFSLGMAQSNLNDLLAAGLNDAERYTTSYLAPVTEAGVYSISNGWYNSADAKPLGGFEISIVGNLTGFKNKDDKKSFTLDTADYENLQFADGSTSRQVSTALGDIEGVDVFVEADVNGTSVRADFELPSGLASEDLNFVPSGYIQASVGLIKGTEVKARFLPKIDTDDVKIGLYGFGVQHDFTKHLPADKILPVAISAVIGYTRLSGEYDFTDTDVIAGENQRIDAKFSSWNFSAVVSTKLPVINFYGGLGYITGKSDTDILGTYVVTSGPFQTTYEDPFLITNNVSGVVGNIGTKLKLGFFRINADYNIAEFSTFTFGLNFGFR